MQNKCEGGIEKYVSVQKLWPKLNILEEQSWKWPISFVFLSKTQNFGPLTQHGRKCSLICPIQHNERKKDLLLG